jgi:hypothetical protein
VQLFAPSFVLLFDTFKACTRKLISLETNREGVQGRETPSVCKFIREYSESYNFCLGQNATSSATYVVFPSCSNVHRGDSSARH